MEKSCILEDFPQHRKNGEQFPGMGFVSVQTSNPAKNMPTYCTVDQAKSSAVSCISPGRAHVSFWHWKRCTK